MIPPFELHRPTTVAEAVDLLAALGEGARVHAGGTELVLMLQEGFVEASHLVDIKPIPDLRSIRLDESGGWLILGATARHDEIARSVIVGERFPVLAGLESVLANQRVRNAGTIGGNLAFGEPHADPPALLVAAGAELRLERAGAGRTVPLDGWLRGPFDPDLAPGELLTEIRVPLADATVAYGYERFKALERPSLGVAVRVAAGPDGTIGDVRIVVGCVGGAPQRVEAAAEVLQGASLADLEPALPAIAEIVGREIDAGTDPHGPEDYKRHLAGVLAGRALRQASAELRRALRNGSGEPGSGEPGTGPQGAGPAVRS
jgi:carbon-monoxide dehydrogenase medium subunit